MLPIDSLNLVQVEHLQIGEFARLAEYNNALVVTANRWPGKVSLVLLEGWNRPKTCYESADFHGRAMVYKDVVIEVDPASWSATCESPGAIMLYQDEMALVVKTEEELAAASIQTGRKKVLRRAFFTRWRAVIRNGNQEHVIYEADFTKADAFVLELPAKLLSEIEEL